MPIKKPKAVTEAAINMYMTKLHSFSNEISIGNETPIYKLLEKYNGQCTYLDNYYGSVLDRLDNPTTVLIEGIETNIHIKFLD